jgi:hypothetical protein
MTTACEIEVGQRRYSLGSELQEGSILIATLDRLTDALGIDESFIDNDVEHVFESKWSDVVSQHLRLEFRGLVFFQLAGVPSSKRDWFGRVEYVDNVNGKSGRLGASILEV